MTRSITAAFLIASVIFATNAFAISWSNISSTPTFFEVRPVIFLANDTIIDLESYQTQVDESFSIVQNWYSDQLYGKTFRLYPSVAYRSPLTTEQLVEQYGNTTGIWYHGVAAVANANGLDVCDNDSLYYLVTPIDNITGGWVGSENLGCDFVLPGSAAIPGHMGRLIGGIFDPDWPEFWADETRESQGGVAHEIGHGLGGNCTGGNIPGHCDGLPHSEYGENTIMFEWWDFSQGVGFNDFQKGRIFNNMAQFYNNNCSFGISWNAGLGHSVSQVIFESNFSTRNSTLSNVSVTEYPESYVNLTNLLSGNYEYRWYAKDESNNWNKTSLMPYSVNSSFIFPAPGGGSASRTYAGLQTYLSVNWTDENGLSGYIFSTNNSGTWVNDTWSNFDLSTWAYRKSHNISNSTGAGPGYQVKIIVKNASGTDSGNTVFISNKARPDFGDIRFTNSSGGLLSYWSEKVVNGVNATFWVKIDGNLSFDNQTVFVYYGNPFASNVSDGDSTFDFFDSFDDLSKWTVNHGNWSTTGGIAIVTDSLYRSSLSITSPPDITGRRMRQNFKFANGNTYYDVVVQFQDSNHYLVSQFTPAWWEGYKLGYIRDVAYDGGWGSTYDHQLGLDNTTFYPYETCIYNGNVIGSYKDVQTHSFYDASWAQDWTGATLGITGGGIGTAYIDWLFISKFVYPEPSHGAWGSEESNRVLSSKSDKSMVLNSTVESIVGWKFYANNTIGDWNVFENHIETIPITTASHYSGPSINSTIAGHLTAFSLLWEDDFVSVDGYIFSSNNSGVWTNSSWIPLTGQWSNYSMTLNDTVGSQIMWCIYANNTAGIWNRTMCDSPQSLTAGPTQLRVAMSSPSSINTNWNHSSEYFINATIICTENDCGNVTAYPRYNSSGAVSNTSIFGELLWKANTTGANDEFGQPSYHDGMLFVPSKAINGIGWQHVFALNASTGEQLWNSTVGDQDKTPTYWDGKLLVSTYDQYVNSTSPLLNTFYVLNASTGNQICNSTIDENYYGSSEAPAIDDTYPDTAYICSFSHKECYAFNITDCSKVWTSDLSSLGGADNKQFASSVSLYQNLLFVVRYRTDSNVDTLIALNRIDGSVNWTVNASAGLWDNSATVVPDLGLIILNHGDTRFTTAAIEARYIENGTQTWQTNTIGRGYNTVAYHDGVAYFNSESSTYAVNATNGDIIWNVSIGDFVAYSSVTLTQAGILFLETGAASGGYVGTLNQTIALNMTNGEKLWSHTMDAGSFSSVTVGGGKVFAISDDWYTYAFDMSWGEEPYDNWDMWLHDKELTSYSTGLRRYLGPISCGHMALGDVCNVSWNINASKGVESSWKLDVLAESSNSSIVPVSASSRTVRIVEDLEPPKFSSNSVSSTIAGKPAEFSLEWEDDVELSGYIFSANINGAWVNDTWKPFSSSFSTATKTLENYVGTTVSWRVFANDTMNKWNTSSIFSLTTSKANDYSSGGVQVSNMHVSNTTNISMNDSAKGPISIVTTDGVIPIRVTLLDKPPTGVGPVGIVYAYIEIERLNVSGNANDPYINFEVNMSWLVQNNISKDNISLFRLVNETWVELPTSLSSEDSEKFYYTAQTPGFSYFYIGESIRNLITEEEIRTDQTLYQLICLIVLLSIIAFIIRPSAKRKTH